MANRLILRPIDEPLQIVSQSEIKPVPTITPASESNLICTWNFSTLEDKDPITVSIRLRKMHPASWGPQAWQILANVMHLGYPWPHDFPLVFSYVGDETFNPAFASTAGYLKGALMALFTAGLAAQPDLLRALCSNDMSCHNGTDGFKARMDFNAFRPFSKIRHTPTASYSSLRLLFEFIRDGIDRVQPDVQRIIQQNIHLYPRYNGPCLKRHEVVAQSKLELS